MVSLRYLVVGLALAPSLAKADIWDILFPTKKTTTTPLPSSTKILGLTTYTATTTETFTTTFASVQTSERTVYERVIVNCDTQKPPVAQGLFQCILDCSSLTVQLTACLGSKACMCPTARRLHTKVDTCLSCGAINWAIEQAIKDCALPPAPECATLASSTLTSYRTNIMTSTGTTTRSLTVTSKVPIATTTVQGSVAGTVTYLGDDGNLHQRVTTVPTGSLPVVSSYGKPVTTVTVVGSKAGTVTYTGDANGLPTARVTITPVATQYATGASTGSTVTFGADGLPTMVVYKTKIVTTSVFGTVAGSTTEAGTNGGEATVRVTASPATPIGTTTVFGTSAGMETFKGTDGLPYVRDTVTPVTTITFVATSALTETVLGPDGKATVHEIIGPQTTAYAIGSVYGSTVTFGPDGYPVVVITIDPPSATETAFGLESGAATYVGTDGRGTVKTTATPTTTITTWGTVHTIGVVTGPDGKPLAVVYDTPTGPVTTQITYGLTSGIATVTGTDGLPTLVTTIPPKATTTVIGPVAGTAVSLDGSSDPVKIVTATPTGPVTTLFDVGLHATTYTLTGKDGLPTEYAVSGPVTTSYILGPVAGTSLVVGGDGKATARYTTIPTGPVTTKYSYGLEATTYTFTGSDGLPTEQIVNGPSFTKAILGTVEGTALSFADGSIPIMIITATPTGPVTTQRSYGLYPTTFTITGEDGFPTERIVDGPSASKTVFGIIEGTALSFVGDDFPVEIVTVTPTGPVTTLESFGLQATTYTVTGEDGLPTEQIVKGPSSTTSVLGTAEGTVLSFDADGNPYMIVTATPTGPVTTLFDYGLHATTFTTTGDDGFPTAQIIQGPSATRTVFGTVEGSVLSFDGDVPVEILTVTPTRPVTTQSSFGLQETTYTVTGSDGLPTEQIVNGPSFTKSILGTVEGTVLSFSEGSIPVMVVTATPTGPVTTQRSFGLYPTTFTVTGEDGFPTERVVDGPSATSTVFGTVEGVALSFVGDDFPVEVITVIPTGPVTTESSYGFEATTYTVTGSDGLLTELVVQGPSSTTSLLGTVAGTSLSFDDASNPILIITATPTGPVTTQFSYGLDVTTFTVTGEDGFPTERVVKGPSATSTIFGTVEGTSLSFDGDYPVEIVTITPTGPVATQSSFGVEATTYTFTGEDGLPTEQIVNGPSFTKSILGTVPGTALSLAEDSVPVLIVTATPTGPVTTQHSFGLYPTTFTVTGEDGFPTERVVDGPSVSKTVYGTVEGTSLSFVGDDFPVEIVTITPTGPVTTLSSFGFEGTTYTVTGEDGLPTEQIVNGPSSTTSVLGTVEGTVLSFDDNGAPVMILTATPTGPITTQFSFGLYPTTITVTGEDGFPTERVIQGPSATSSVYGTVEGTSLSFDGDYPVEVITVVPTGPVTTLSSFGLYESTYTVTGDDGLPTEQVINGPSFTKSILGTVEGTVLSFADDSIPIMIVTATPTGPVTTQHSYGLYPTTFTVTGEDGFPTERIVDGPSASKTVFGTVEGTALSFLGDDFPVEIVTVIPTGPVTTMSSYGFEATTYTVTGSDGLPTEQVVDGPSSTTSILGTVEGTVLSFNDDGQPIMIVTATPTGPVTTQFSFGLYPTTVTVTGDDGFPTERVVKGPSATSTVFGTVEGLSLSFDGDIPVEILTVTPTGPIITLSSFGIEPSTYTVTGTDGLPTEHLVNGPSFTKSVLGTVEGTSLSFADDSVPVLVVTATPTGPVTTQHSYGLYPTTFTVTGEDGFPTERVVDGPSASKTVFGTVEGTSLSFVGDDFPVEVVTVVPTGPVTTLSSFGFEGTTYTVTGEDGLPTEQVVDGPSSTTSVLGTLEGTILSFGEDGVPVMIVTATPTGPITTQFSYGLYPTTVTVTGEDGFPTERVVMGPSATSTIYGTVEGTSLSFDGDDYPVEIVTVTPTGPVTTMSSFGIEPSTYTVTGEDGLPTEQIINGPSFTKSILGTVEGTSLSFADDSIPVLIVTATPTGPVTTQHSFGLYPTTFTITGEDGFPTERVVDGPSASKTVFGTVEGTSLSFVGDDFPVEIVTNTPTGPVTTLSSFGFEATTFTITGEDGLPTEQIVDGPSSSTTLLGTVPGTALTFDVSGNPIMIVTATPTGPVTTQHSFGLVPTTYTVTGEDGFPTERVVDGPSATRSVFGTVEGTSLSFDGDYPVEFVTVIPTGPVTTMSSFGFEGTTYTTTGEDGLPTEQVVQGPSLTKSILGTVAGTTLSFGDDGIPVMVVTATPTGPVTTQHSYGLHPTTFTITGEDGFPIERIVDGPSASKTVFGTVAGTSLSFDGQDFPIEVVTVVPTAPVATISSFGLHETTFTITGEDGLPTEQIINGPSFTKLVLGTVEGTVLSFGENGDPVMIVTATPTSPVTTQFDYGLVGTTFTSTGEDGFPTEHIILGPSATQTKFGTVEGTSLVLDDEFPIEIITIVPTAPVTTLTSYGFEATTYTFTGEDGLPTEQVMQGPSSTKSVLGTVAGTALSFGEDHVPVLVVTTTPTGPVTTQFSYGLYPATITTIGEDGFPTERVIEGPSSTQTIIGTAEGTTISFDGDGSPVEVVTITPTAAVATQSTFGFERTTYTFTGEDGLPTEQVVQGPSFTKSVIGTVEGTGLSIAAGSIPVLVVTATPTGPVTTQFSYGLDATTFTITGDDGLPTERVVQGPSATRTVFGTVGGSVLSFDGNFPVEIVTVVPTGPVTTQSTYGIEATTYTTTGTDGLPTEQIVNGPSFTKSILGTVEGTVLSFAENGVPVMIVTATPTAPVTTQFSYGLNPTTYTVTGEDGFPTERVVEGPSATRTVFGTAEGTSLSIGDEDYPVAIVTVIPTGPVTTDYSFGLEATTYTTTGEDGLPTEQIVSGPSSTKSFLGTVAGTWLSFDEASNPIMIVTATPTAPVTTQHSFGLYPTTFTITGDDGFPTEREVDGPSATSTVFGTVEGVVLSFDGDIPVEIVTVAPTGPVTTISSFGLHETTLTITGEDGLLTEQIVNRPSSTSSILGTVEGTILSFDENGNPIMVVTATPTGPVTTISSFGLQATAYTVTGEDGFPTEQIVNGPSFTKSVLGTVPGTSLSFADGSIPIIVVTASPSAPVTTQHSFGLYPTTFTVTGEDGYPTERVVDGPSATKTVYGTEAGVELSLVADDFPVEIVTIVPTGPVTTLSSFGFEATTFTVTGSDGLPSEQIVKGPSSTTSILGTAADTVLSFDADGNPVMIVTATPTAAITTQHSFGLYPTTFTVTGEDGFPTERVVDGPSSSKTVFGTVAGTSLSFDGIGYPVEVVTVVLTGPVTTMSSFGLAATTFTTTGSDGLPTEQIVNGPSFTKNVLGTVPGTSLSFADDSIPIMVVTATPTGPVTTQHSFGLYPTTVTVTGEDGFPTERVVDGPSATSTVFGTVEGTALSFVGDDFPVEIVTISPTAPVTTQFTLEMEATTFNFTGEDGLPTEQIVYGPSSTMSVMGTSAGTLLSMDDSGIPIMVVTAVPTSPITTQFSYGLYPTTVTVTGEDGYPTERVVKGPSSTETVFGTVEGTLLSFDGDIPIGIVTVIPTGPVTTLSSYGFEATTFIVTGTDGLSTEQVVQGPSSTESILGTVPGTVLTFGKDGDPYVIITATPTAPVTTQFSYELEATTFTTTGDDGFPTGQVIQGPSATRTVFGTVEGTGLSLVGDDFPVEIITVVPSGPVTTESTFGFEATTLTVTGEDGLRTEQIINGPSTTETVRGTVAGTTISIDDDGNPVMIIAATSTGPVITQYSIGLYPTTITTIGDDGFPTERIVEGPSATTTVYGTVEGTAISFDGEDPVEIVTVVPTSPVTTLSSFGLQETTYTVNGSDGLPTEYVINGPSFTKSVFGTQAGTELSFAASSIPIMVVTATPTAAVTTQFDYGLHPTTFTVTGEDGLPTEQVIQGPSTNRIVFGTVEGTALSLDGDSPVEVITIIPTGPVTTMSSFGYKASTYTITGEDGLATEQIVQGPSSTTSVLGTVAGTSLIFDEFGNPVMVVTATPTAPVTTQHSYGLYPTTFTVTGEDGFPTERVVVCPSSAETVVGTVEGTSLLFDGQNSPIKLVTVVPTTTKSSSSLEETTSTTEQVTYSPSSTNSATGTASDTFLGYFNSSIPIVTSTPIAPVTTMHSYGLVPTTFTVIGEDGFGIEKIVDGPSATRTIFGTVEGTSLSFVGDSLVEIVTVVPAGPVTTHYSYGMTATTYTVIGDDGLPTEQVIKGPSRTMSVMGTSAGTQLRMGDDGLPIMIVTATPTGPVTTQFEYGLHGTTFTTTGADGFPTEMVVKGPSATETVFGAVKGTSLSFDANSIPIEIITIVPSSSTMTTESRVGLEAPSRTSTVFGTVPGTSLSFDGDNDPVEIVTVVSTTPATTLSSSSLVSTTTGEDGLPTTPIIHGDDQGPVVTSTDTPEALVTTRTTPGLSSTPATGVDGTNGPTTATTSFSSVEKTSLVHLDDTSAATTESFTLQVTTGSSSTESVTSESSSFESSSTESPSTESYSTESVSTDPLFNPQTTATTSTETGLSTEPTFDTSFVTTQTTTSPAAAVVLPVTTETTTGSSATTVTVTGEDGLPTERVAEGPSSTKSNDGTGLVTGDDHHPTEVTTQSTTSTEHVIQPSVTTKHVIQSSATTEHVIQSSATTEHVIQSSVSFTTDFSLGVEATTLTETGPSSTISVIGSVEGTLSTVRVNSSVQTAASTQTGSLEVTIASVRSSTQLASDSIVTESGSTNTEPSFGSAIAITRESSSTPTQRASDSTATETALNVHSIASVRADQVSTDGNVAFEPKTTDAVRSPNHSVQVDQSTSLAQSTGANPDAVIFLSLTSMIVATEDSTKTESSSSVSATTSHPVAEIPEPSVLSDSSSHLVDSSARSTSPNSLSVEPISVDGSTEGSSGPSSKSQGPSPSTQSSSGTSTNGPSSSVRSQGTASQPIASSSATTHSVSIDVAHPSQIPPPSPDKPLQANGASSLSIPFAGLLTTALLFLV